MLWSTLLKIRQYNLLLKIQIIKKLDIRTEGATSEETAKTAKELKLDERWLKMSANTIIPSDVVATKDGRYYLISKKTCSRFIF